MGLRTLLLVGLLLATTQTHAALQAIAITGTSASSIPDAEFSIGENVFPLARLSNNGTVAFQATLNPTTLGVNSGNDDVIFRFDEGNSDVAFREGSGGVPNLPTANFASFSNFGIANQGSILVRGQLVTDGDINSSNSHGFWKFAEAETSEVARTGSMHAPGFSNTRFDSLSFNVRHSDNGTHVYDARLKGEGGVTSLNDNGIWLNINGAGSLVARENQTAPGVGAPFDIFGTPSVSNNGDVAFRGQLKTGGAISSTNRIGVWNYSAGVGSLIARIGSGGVPGSPGNNFTAFEDPIMNSSGQLLLNATVNATNSGLWRYNGTTGQLLAIESGAVPDVTDTTFFEIRSPLLSDIGQVVAWGQMNTGPSVSLLNNTGLWAFDEVKGNRLLARTGVEGTVPGKPESTFAGLGRYATNGLGDVLLTATLNESFGDVGHDGIWIYPYEGEPQLLVQSGDAVGERTIERLQLLSPNSQESVTSIFNDAKQFVFQAEFTNGDFGLLLYSPGAIATYAEADFNIDGYVDSTDLEWWADAFGETAMGDADDDGDTDGRDYLIWQRQFTGSSNQSALAVPEPTVWWFVALIFGIAQHRSTFAAVRCV
jgi:hypothetical protein